MTPTVARAALLLALAAEPAPRASGGTHLKYMTQMTLGRWGSEGVSNWQPADQQNWTNLRLFGRGYSDYERYGWYSAIPAPGAGGDNGRCVVLRQRPHCLHRRDSTLAD